MAKKTGTKGSGPADLSELPGPALAIASIGPESREWVSKHYPIGQLSLFQPGLELYAEAISEALRASKWGDASTALLMPQVLEVASTRPAILKDIPRWIAGHVNDVIAVRDCIGVSPPAGMTVLKRLSQDGSEKIVFLCSWDGVRPEVVLKQFRAKGEEARRRVEREKYLNPLSRVSHDNILESQQVVNSDGETFQVEEFLPTVLSDKWRSNGVEESACLLYDIASALSHLHDNLLIHGDVKPPNMGLRGDKYVLLDFGIARPAAEYAEASPTGSLRTRPPETLDGSDLSPEDVCKIDVWALGASVFNAVAGRYPLFHVDEDPPRVWESKRADFALELRRRAADEWDSYVDLSVLPRELREPLRSALTRDIRERPTARQLLNITEHELGPYLRHSEHFGTEHMSLAEEIQQYEFYMLSNPNIRYLPGRTRKALSARLQKVRDSAALSDDNRRVITRMLDTLANGSEPV